MRKYEVSRYDKLDGPAAFVILCPASMKLDGTSPFVMHGASPAPRTVVITNTHAAAKKITARILSRLMTWVGREQRVK